MSDVDGEELAEAIVKQPCEGILYDLNLLPEVLKSHDKEQHIDWIRMNTIKVLKDENQSLQDLLRECRSKLKSYGKMKAEGKRRDFCNRRDEQEGEEILELCQRIDNQLGSGDDE